MGSPVAMRIGNTEWPQVGRGHVRRAGRCREPLRARGRGAPLTRPRPGHADLVGMQKYGFDEARPVLERASARETAARVALGAVARALPRRARHHARQPHARRSAPSRVPEGAALPDARRRRARSTPTRCAASTRRHPRAMVAEVDDAHKDGDTLGGVVEVLAYGLPPGLGSYVHWDRRLDARLAAALMGIQAIKGVEVGDGFRPPRRRGSQAHDELVRRRDGRHHARRATRPAAPRAA